MNLAELVELAKYQALGPSRSGDLLDVNDVVVKAHINKAYHRVENAGTWKWSEKEDDELVVSKGEYRLNAGLVDLGVPLLAYNVDSKTMLDYVDDRQRVQDADDRGVINSYTEYGGELRFYPRASKDTTVMVRYYAKWLDLVDGNDRPVFPEAHHHILADYATGMMLLRIPPTGDRFLPESAARPWLQSWEEGVAEMIMSPLNLKTLDAIRVHAHDDMIFEGEQNWW